MKPEHFTGPLAGYFGLFLLLMLWPTLLAPPARFPVGAAAGSAGLLNKSLKLCVGRLYQLIYFTHGTIEPSPILSARLRDSGNRLQPTAVLGASLYIRSAGKG